MNTLAYVMHIFIVVSVYGRLCCFFTQYAHENLQTVEMHCSISKFGYTMTYAKT